MRGDATPSLILASASPRRRELLSLLDIPFEPRPVTIDETVEPSRRPDFTARRLAREKAEAARLGELRTPIIAADTVVVLDGEMLGKPSDAREAGEMLRRLRGRQHEVMTGVAMLPENDTGTMLRHVTTTVRMRDYGDEELEAYIAGGAPLDKAGGYGIQDEPFAPVDSYEGCYCNVVGLPLWTTLELLRRAGFDVSGVRAEHLLPQCATCPLRI